MMTLTYRNENGVCVIPIEYKLDEENAAIFEKYTDDVVNNHSFQGVIISFKNVVRLGSAGVGAIVSVFKKLKKENIQLVLCHMSDEVANPFYMIRLDNIINIYPTEKEALSVFQDPKNRYESLTVRVPQQLISKLNDLSQETGKNLTTLIEEALSQYISPT